MNIYIHSIKENCFVSGDVREDFRGFTNITGDTIGENIADAIINKLESANIDLANMRAQAYDGTGQLI